MITYNKANINGGLDEANTEVYGENVIVNVLLILAVRLFNAEMNKRALKKRKQLLFV